MKEHRMHRLLIMLSLLVFFTIGCTPVLENAPRFTHTAALMIGDSKDNVMSQAEHICGKPKDVGYVTIDTPQEIEIRRYSFFIDADILLYFYKGIFIQASIIDPQSRRFPNLRKDYKEVNSSSTGPAGYLLTLQGNTGTIKEIQKNERGDK